MFKFLPGREQVDRKNVETDWNAVSVALGKLPEVGGGHAAERFLFVWVDLGFSGRQIVGGAGFDLKDDEGIAVPGDKIEVSSEAFRAPAAGDDGVAEAAEVEKRGIFSAFTGEEMGWFGGFSVGKALESGVGAAFQRKCKCREGHGGRIRWKMRNEGANF